MTQQNWPFENAITGLASGAEINESEDDEDADDEDADDEDADDEDADDEDADDEDVDDDHVVFIVEGTQLGYGSKRAWDAAH